MVVTQEMAVLFFDLMIHFAESQTSYTTFEILPPYISKLTL